jgi:hypothetical protein
MREPPADKPRANQPGPGRSTSEAALNARKKEIAELNDRAFKKARVRREAREHEQAERRRAADLL